MSRLPRTIWFCMLAAAPAWAQADGTTSQLGFGYCSPPVVPACIARAAVRRPGQVALQVCSADVLRFTQSLGEYRTCLDRESERAIGAGNAAIARFRCVAQGGRRCR